VEFLEAGGPLTDPRAHGADPADAFHVVIPSLPGFVFSSPLSARGWNLERTAVAFGELMPRLGYERFGTSRCPRASTWKNAPPSKRRNEPGPG